MFIENAREGKNNFWLYFASTLLVILAFLAGQVPMLVLLLISAVRAGTVNAPDQFTLATWEADPNLQLVLVIFPFVTAMIALFLCMKHIHKRHSTTVITARKRMDWGRVFFASGTWLFLLLLTDLIFYMIDPGNYVFQLNWQLFIPLVVISLFFIPFQAAFEEIFLRGYLMQGFGLAFRYRWIAILLTSLIFGLLHAFNPEIDAFGFYKIMPFYIGFGLVMAIAAVMDNGLEIPIGMHAMNNIYGAMLVTYPASALQTPAIFRIREIDLDLMLLLWLGFSVIFLIIASRKYKWGSWQKLIAPIEKNAD